MTSELDVVLHGGADVLPAGRVLQQLSSLVELLGLVEDTAVRRDRAPADRSDWSFGELGLGSVHARLRPLRRAPGTSVEQLVQVPLRVIDGFAHAEAHDDLPPGWSEVVADAGRRVSRPLGDHVEQGMTLTLVENGEAVRVVEVTRRTASNLTHATNRTASSLGSVIGTLASANTRDKRAGLWTELDDRRIAVALSDDLLETLRANLGERVLVAGTLTRNASGQVLNVHADQIIPWPRSAMRLSESAGVARAHPTGEDSATYLERVGGWAT